MARSTRAWRDVSSLCTFGSQEWGRAGLSGTCEADLALNAHAGDHAECLTMLRPTRCRPGGPSTATARSAWWRPALSSCGGRGRWCWPLRRRLRAAKRRFHGFLQGPEHPRPPLFTGILHLGDELGMHFYRFMPKAGHFYRTRTPTLCRPTLSGAAQGRRFRREQNQLRSSLRLKPKPGPGR